MEPYSLFNLSSRSWKGMRHEDQNPGTKLGINYIKCNIGLLSDVWQTGHQAPQTAASRNDE